MLDLSKYADNKDSYIVNLEIDKLFDKFKVTYGSGRIEEHDFSIHNYQVYINRMEQQYRDYSQDYVDELNNEFIRNVVKVLVENVIIMGGVALECGLDIHLAIKIALAFLGSLVFSYNLYRVMKYKRKTLDEADKLALIELCIKKKEDVALDVIDPVSGRNEKWYMVDVNNVEQFNNSMELAMYAAPFKYPQIKDEMSKDMTKAFKDAYTLKKRKNS